MPSTLNALAKVWHYDKMLFAQLVSAAMSKTRDFNSQNIANTLNALAKVGLVPEGKTKLAEFNSQQIANTLHALAKWHSCPDGVFNLFIDQFKVGGSYSCSQLIYCYKKRRSGLDAAVKVLWSLPGDRSHGSQSPRTVNVACRRSLTITENWISFAWGCCSESWPRKKSCAAGHLNPSAKKMEVLELNNFDFSWRFSAN